jgi:ATP-dependent Clp protease ATP-binding subunit ClpC
MKEIERFFRPEFINRLDDIIVFHPLTREHIAQIVGILFQQVADRVAAEGFALQRTDAATEFLVDRGYDEQYGARPLKRAIQRHVEDPLSEKILLGEIGKGDGIEVDVAPGGEQLKFRVLTESKA